MAALEGRCVVVTGASSGIGAATARALGREGAHLMLAARRVERLETVAREVEALGGSAQFFALDVTDAEQCAEFAARVGAERTPDALVNNAGLARGMGPVLEADEGDWREMFEANVMGLMRLTRAFLPQLLTRSRADIVHVGSVAGLDPYPGGAAYCASKAAVEAFAKSLRRELLGTRVRQLVIQPGMVETEFSEVRFHGDSARAERVYDGVVPLSAEDVAECICFGLTRPPHVSIQSLLVMPTAQVTATELKRAELVVEEPPH